MAWRRHTRNLTKEVFYDGTTVDGTRLEKAVNDIVEGVNSVEKGNTKQRFVATQYHSGFNPPNRNNTAPPNYSKWPWLQLKNNATSSSMGVVPEGAPTNPQRLKGTSVPGINQQEGLGDQYVWTRTLYFDKPVVLHGVSIFLHNDTGANGDRPYTGQSAGGVTLKPYTYFAVGTGVPPQGFSPTSDTVDLPIVLDVMNPGTPEDAEMTDVEFTRTLYTINGEPSSTHMPNATATGWNDFQPHYDSGDVTDARPLYGRVVEYRGLNIPVHQRARVRLAVAIPLYDGTTYTQATWGTEPWYLQAWSSTITVLEEVQTL
tara:strand:- start:2898 stop:3845 length:948 start_codon:yes stop_codon:yes gene_type:complete